jgi:beta-lactamase regulating signal transducer with metallopeptidase domain/5-hydroxyisourate hydrolase-like protein (transthyretin family)
MTWDQIIDRLATASLPWELAANVLLQTTLVLAAGLVAGRLSKSGGAAVQSLVYRTTLVAVLLCPLVAFGFAAGGFDRLLIDIEPYFQPPAPHSQIAAGLPISADTAELSPIDLQRPPRDIADTALASDITAGADSRATPQFDHLQQVSLPASGHSPEPLAIDEPPSQPEPARAGVAVTAAILGAVAWLTVSLYLLIRLAIAQLRTVRLRRLAIPADAAETALCRQIAAELHVSPPDVLRAPFLSGACLVGYWQPAVLLPDADDAPLRQALLHELVHLSRGDCLWNLLRQLATALLPVQPLVWLLARRIEQTAEEVCDDFVVQHGADRCRYAEHLVELASRNLAPALPAGVGMISFRSLSARRIARILDASRTLSTRVGGRTIVATLLTAIAVTLLTASVGIGVTEAEAVDEQNNAESTVTSDEPDSSKASDHATNEKRTISGQVLDADGKPVAGATVTAARFRPQGIGPYGWDKDREELARVQSDAAGRFTISFPPLDPDDPLDYASDERWQRLLVTAWATGHGPIAIDSRKLPDGNALRLRLARDDVPISGRVVDLEGRPLAGVMVNVYKLWGTTDSEKIDQWRKQLTQPEAQENIFEAASRAFSGRTRPRSHYFPISGPALPESSPELPDRVKTDDDGRFRITGLGRDRLVLLELKSPTVAFQRVQVVTRPMARVDGRRLDEPGIQDSAFHGAECTIVAQPALPIEGVIRDAENGRPIAGATVTAVQVAGSRFSIEGLINATSDEQGRYRLIGLPKGDGHKLAVYPPIDQPYFITEDLTVSAGPDLKAVTYDIALRRGIWITGRVTDNVTGEPAQAAIHYFPYLANERAQRYPNFRPNFGSATWTGDRYRTDADGNYRVVGIRGKGLVAAMAFDRTYVLGVGAEQIEGANERGVFPVYNDVRANIYHALKAVAIPDSDSSAQVDLQLDPGEMVSVQLVDPAGRELIGVRVAGQYPQRWGSPNLESPLTTSRHDLHSIGQKDGRAVLFLHEERKLAAIVPTEKLRRGVLNTITLRPCAAVTGRLIDADGKPVAGGVEIAEMSLKRNSGGLTELARLSTDKDGRFQYDLLPAEGSLNIWARYRSLSSGGTPNDPQQFKSVALANDLKAKPGETIDFGTFDVTTGKRVAADEKPKVMLRSKVVDPDGKPVAGARVMVWQDADKNAATSGDDGSFEIALTKDAAAKEELIITAEAKGFGMGWIAAKPNDQAAPIKLPPTVPITGRIVDLEGQPVAGVTVTVEQITMPENGLDGWIEAVRRGQSPPSAYRRLGKRRQPQNAVPYGPTAEKPVAVTDAEGRFRIEGIGAERMLQVSMRGATVAFTKFRVLTRPLTPINWQYGEMSFRHSEQVYGADFTHAAQPSRPIRGVIRDAKTAEPLAGVHIESNKFAGTNLGGVRDLKTTTDAEGRFELLGMPKGEGNVIEVIPNDGQPYFAREIEVPSPPGIDPVVVTIDLHRGLWITGRVTDKASGKPVKGANMHYMPFLTNPYAQSHPAFDERGIYTTRPGRRPSDENGVYRLVGLPGPAVVGVGISNEVTQYRRGVGFEEIAAQYGKADDRGGHLKTWGSPGQPGPKWPFSMAAINPTNWGEQVELDLQLDPGLRVPVEVLDTDGQPIEGATAIGRSAYGHDYGEKFGPRFDVINLAPDETRAVIIRHEARALGKVINVSPRTAQGGLVSVRLAPFATITGRVVDFDGKPVAVAAIRPDLLPSGDFTESIAGAVTDDDGRFRVENVPVGCDYSLLVLPRANDWLASKKVSVKPGETIDVGDIQPKRR